MGGWENEFGSWLFVEELFIRFKEFPAVGQWKHIGCVDYIWENDITGIPKTTGFKTRQAIERIPTNIG